MNTEDALEMIMAGATAVAVGTANFHNPYATVEIIFITPPIPMIGSFTAFAT